MRELVQLAEKRDEFLKLGIAVYAIAPQDVTKLTSLQEDLGNGVTLLSDPDLKAAVAFGVLERFGLPRAATFLIDRAGEVSHRWLAENYRKRPSPETILGKARE